MTELKRKYKTFIKELEDTITDKSEQKIVKEKFNELFIYVLDQFDKIIDNYDKKIETILLTQKALSTKTDLLDKNVREMQKDFYEEDEYDFEIICPYCNYNFVIDLDEDSKNEIACPECNNIIELDWNEECDCEHDECGCFESCTCGCQEGNECTCNDECSNECDCGCNDEEDDM